MVKRITILVVSRCHTANKFITFCIIIKFKTGCAPVSGMLGEKKLSEFHYSHIKHDLPELLISSKI